MSLWVPAIIANEAPRQRVTEVDRRLHLPQLIGDKDDWTPAAPCEGLHAHQEQRAPGRVRLIVYPGATHSFDFNSPRRYNEYGKLLAFDASATRDAQRRVEAFLAKVLPR